MAAGLKAVGITAAETAPTGDQGYQTDRESLIQAAAATRKGRTDMTAREEAMATTREEVSEITREEATAAAREEATETMKEEASAAAREGVTEKMTGGVSAVARERATETVREEVTATMKEEVSEQTGSRSEAAEMKQEVLTARRASLERRTSTISAMRMRAE